MSKNPWRRDERPLAIAHRGHSIELPENTLPAYRRAIELGAEMIECDVNVTRDGKLVMIHDWTLDRTTNGSGRVSDATWEEIQCLDAGSWFSPEFEGLRIPSTEETLDLAAEAGVFVSPEIKGADAEEAVQIAEALVELLEPRDMLETTVLCSYHHAALAVAKALIPNLMLAPERLPDDEPADPPEALRQAQALDALVISHRHSAVTAELVHTLHENDIAIWAWSTNSEQSLMGCVELGVDGVMGDDVRLMMDVLDR